MRPNDQASPLPSCLCSGDSVRIDGSDDGDDDIPTITFKATPSAKRNAQDIDNIKKVFSEKVDGDQM